jgi:hypothetical protein
VKEAYRLKTIAKKLARNYGMNLKDDQAYLRLEMVGRGVLVIERLQHNCISVANYFINADKLEPDPDVVCWINPEKDVWCPIGIKQIEGGTQTCAIINPKRGTVAQYYGKRQMHLTKLLNGWALDLADEGWLHDALAYDRNNQVLSPVQSQ